MYSIINDQERAEYSQMLADASPALLLHCIVRIINLRNRRNLWMKHLRFSIHDLLSTTLKPAPWRGSAWLNPRLSLEVPEGEPCPSPTRRGLLPLAPSLLNVQPLDSHFAGLNPTHHLSKIRIFYFQGITDKRSSLSWY